MPTHARYNTGKAICGMSTRSAPHRDEALLAESCFRYACAERGPLEAAPGNVLVLSAEF
jgi:hypothetical protein